MLRTAINRARGVRRDEGGFTLIELLIVIVILGILAAIVVFSVRGITDRGDLSACKTEVRTVETAYEAAVAQSDPKDTTWTPAELKAAKFLRSDPKYVATVTETGVTLTSAAPAGCAP